jgi:hypothetical protein
LSCRFIALTALAHIIGCTGSAFDDFIRAFLGFCGTRAFYFAIQTVIAGNIRAACAVFHCGAFAIYCIRCTDAFGAYAIRTHFAGFTICFRSHYANIAGTTNVTADAFFRVAIAGFVRSCAAFAIGGIASKTVCAFFAGAAFFIAGFFRGAGAFVVVTADEAISAFFIRGAGLARGYAAFFLCGIANETIFAGFAFASAIVIDFFFGGFRLTGLLVRVGFVGNAVVAFTLAVGLTFFAFVEQRCGVHGAFLCGLITVIALAIAGCGTALAVFLFAVFVVVATGHHGRGAETQSRKH